MQFVIQIIPYLLKVHALNAILLTVPIVILMVLALYANKDIVLVILMELLSVSVVILLIVIIVLVRIVVLVVNLDILIAMEYVKLSI